MILKTEIATDPLGRGYSSMTDLEVATDLNIIYREVDVESVSGQEIFEAVVPLEYNVLTDKQINLLHAIMGLGSISVNGINTRTALLSMFGSGTTTRSNLATLQKRDVSRAEELGLPYVYEGHVQEARI